MRSILSLLLAATALAGCTVGPDYKGPPVSASDAVQRGRFVRADAAASDAPVVARWWEGMGDPLLTRLIDDALAHSPTLDQASARIREAEARFRQQRTADLPSLSANGTVLGARIPGLDLGQGGAGSSAQSVEFYNAGLNASWEIDLFGGGRRGVQQARATIGARDADLADAQVSLSAQVAQAYVTLRDLQARIRLNDLSARAQTQQLALLRQRFDRGAASRLDVERAQGQLENTTAQTIPLAAQRDEQLGLLAILTGRTPGALDATLATPGAVPLPPREVAVGDPGALLSRRPDIRAAERQLAAATAGIGVAKAKELPGIRFLGLLGIGGPSIGDVFDPGNLVALGAPSLNWSFLDFGRAKAATAAAQAQADLAEATYRQTVLEALQETETALSRFGNARSQLGRLMQAEATVERAATLNRQRVTAGTATLIDQLDVERQRLSAAIAVSQARAALATSYVGVNKALGLGWSAAQGR
ncbi:efflux transporter outer membrane subunit [Sphingomonas sp. VNH70]|uniref:efflux transporter outer membrane subunit n=1 Tax=Sphingomonas silueang TaxID=3156617 RepID=UPI0032B3B992